MIKIGKSVFFLGSFNLLLYFIVFGKNIFFASIFGTTIQTDIFFVNQTINDFVILIILGFLPLYISIYSDSLKDTDNSLSSEFTSTIMISIFVFYLFFILIPMIIFPSEIIGLFIKNTSVFNMQIALKAYKVFLVIITIHIFTNFFSGIMNSHHLFNFSTILNIITQLIIFASIILFNHKIGIFSVIAGLLVSAILTFIIYICYFKKMNVFKKLSFNLNNIYFKRLLNQILYYLLISLLWQLNIMTYRYFSSKLGAGSFTGFDFASKLAAIPSEIFILPLFNVIIPVFSRFYWDKDLDKVSESYIHWTGIIIFLMAPLSVFFFLNSSEIVKVIYYRGAFNSNSVNLTSLPLKYLGLGLVFYSLSIFQGGIFIACHNLKELIYPRIIMVLLSAVFSFFLTRLYGNVGLGIAWMIVFFILSVSQFYIIKNKLKISINNQSLFKNLIRYFFSLIVFSAFLFIIKKIFFFPVSFPVFIKIFYLLFIFILSLLPYLFFSKFIGLYDFNKIMDFLKVLLNGKKTV